MEDAPLNKAHQEYRFAERHLRYRRFDEAIQSHQKAAAYLQEAMKVTSSTKAYESMQCQYEYHMRQQEIVRIKKHEYENYLKAIETHRLKITNMLLSNDVESNKQQSDSLQLAIYKTMNQADSLLGLLINKDNDSGDNESEKLCENDQVDGTQQNTPSVLQGSIGSKRPKGDDTVIEELRTLNNQLHSLVSQLITQLENSNREIELLREKIRILEEEKVKQHVTNNTNETTNNKLNNHNLKTTIDSSGGTSPFIVSPCSELSPDMQTCMRDMTLDSEQTKNHVDKT